MDSYLILYGAVSVLLVALNLLNTLKTNGAAQAQQRKNLLVLASRVSFVLLCRGGRLTAVRNGCGRFPCSSFS